METPNRVQALTEEMIKKDGKGPKMRTKGAETRGLVPFAVECAQSLHEKEGTVHTLTMVKAMSNLVEFYLVLGMEDFNPDLAANARRNFFASTKHFMMRPSLKCFGSSSQSFITSRSLRSTRFTI